MCSDVEFIQFVERNAERILNMTSDIPKSAEKMQELDELQFVRQVRKNRQLQPSKTHILAYFVLDWVSVYERVRSRFQEVRNSFRTDKERQQVIYTSE